MLHLIKTDAGLFFRIKIFGFVEIFGSSRFGVGRFCAESGYSTLETQLQIYRMSSENVTSENQTNPWIWTNAKMNFRGFQSQCWICMVDWLVAFIFFKIVYNYNLASIQFLFLYGLESNPSARTILWVWPYEHKVCLYASMQFYKKNCSNDSYVSKQLYEESVRTHWALG